MATVVNARVGHARIWAVAYAAPTRSSPLVREYHAPDEGPYAAPRCLVCGLAWDLHPAPVRAAWAARARLRALAQKLRTPHP